MNPFSPTHQSERPNKCMFVSEDTATDLDGYYLPIIYPVHVYPPH